MPRMLGKKPAVHDPRTVKLRSYLAPQLPAIPQSADWAGKMGDTGPVFLNTELGDCAIAMAANGRRTWTANKSDMVSVTDEQVLEGYQRIGGYRQGNPATDNGCVMLDVLKAWRQEGVCGGRIAAFASVQPTDQEMAKAGIHLFGGLLMGVQLPAAVQDNHGDWKAPSDPRMLIGEWQKGSWGGHAVFGPKFDPDWLYFWSWGKLMRMSWNFFHWYSDEAYVAVSADWLGADFMAPNGIAMSDLLKDVGAIAS